MKNDKLRMIMKNRKIKDMEMPKRVRVPAWRQQGVKTGRPSQKA
jgi:hypothetical protein